MCLPDSCDECVKNRQPCPNHFSQPDLRQHARAYTWDKPHQICMGTCLSLPCRCILPTHPWIPHCCGLAAFYQYISEWSSSVLRYMIPTPGTVLARHLRRPSHPYLLNTTLRGQRNCMSATSQVSSGLRIHVILIRFVQMTQTTNLKIDQRSFSSKLIDNRASLHLDPFPHRIGYDTCSCCSWRQP